jgi:hypothetical protein
VPRDVVSQQLPQVAVVAAAGVERALRRVKPAQQLDRGQLSLS